MEDEITRHQIISEGEPAGRMVERAPIGMCTVDTRGVIDYTNPKFLEISGGAREAVVGSNVLEEPLYKEFGLDTLVRATLEQGKPFDTEIHHLLPTGTGLYWHCMGVPLRGADGAIDHALCLVEDITERIAKTKNIADIFYSLIQTSNTGILFVNEDNIISVVNKSLCKAYNLDETPEQLMGVSADALMEKSQRMAKNPKEFAERIVTLKRERKPVFNEEILFADGRVAERDYFPVMTESGDFIGHLWQYRDVTDSKRKTEELERINRFMTGRELRMVELKQEIAALKSGKTNDTHPAAG